MAAAVFDVGRLVQSPKPNILAYFVCCSVYGSRSRYPDSSAIGAFEFWNTAGADMGGVTWMKSY